VEKERRPWKPKVIKLVKWWGLGIGDQECLIPKGDGEKLGIEEV